MRKLLVIICLGLMTLGLNCGDDSGDSDLSSKQVEAPRDKFARPTTIYTPEGGIARFDGKGFTEQQIADLLEIEANMTDALIRWSYRDKAALYENELEYVQDRWTLEEYLNQTRVKAANSADSIVGFYVTGGQFFDRDSVIIDDVVIFIGVGGNRIDFVNKDKLYFHRGRWVRPTVSLMREQLEYEALIMRADSAAAAEEEEGF